ncbi:hypothetical protein EJ06DRAFT_95281 [Trichodelitschia bisporula]|uniref:Transmembrane protein n=1 Tax=Trichodelitschia bisporula TaxID=703511 RepID=A0A6G1HST6_9PEZI|nr:hypothetical protein EJ06DRAFT_95281 [Trichodelitschia bisporula]
MTDVVWYNFRRRKLGVEGWCFLLFVPEPKVGRSRSTQWAFLVSRPSLGKRRMDGIVSLCILYLSLFFFPPVCSYGWMIAIWLFWGNWAGIGV